MGDFAETPSRYRHFTAIRSALIAYGVAAFTWLWTRTDALGGAVAGKGAVLALLGGVGVQILLIVVGRLIRKYAPDPASAATASMVLELIADSVTVALFAIGTFASILRIQDSI